MGMKPLAATTVPPNVWPVFKVSARIRPRFTKLRMTTVIPSTKSIAARAVCKRSVICWLAMALFKSSTLAGMSIEAVHKSAEVYSRGHSFARLSLLLFKVFEDYFRLKIWGDYRYGNIMSNASAKQKLQRPMTLLAYIRYHRSRVTP